jgi:hypothetical protein
LVDEAGIQHWEALAVSRIRDCLGMVSRNAAGYGLRSASASIEQTESAGASTDENHRAWRPEASAERRHAAGHMDPAREDSCPDAEFGAADRGHRGDTAGVACLDSSSRAAGVTVGKDSSLASQRERRWVLGSGGMQSVMAPAWEDR